MLGQLESSGGRSSHTHCWMCVNEEKGGGENHTRGFWLGPQSNAFTRDGKSRESGVRKERMACMGHAAWGKPEGHPSGSIWQEAGNKV